VDSIDSTAKPKQRKARNTEVKTTKSDSDFDMSNNTSDSESSDEVMDSSVDDTLAADAGAPSSMDETISDTVEVSFKQVTKRKDRINVGMEEPIIHEGRLTQFPKRRLQLSKEELQDSILTQLQRNGSAARIVSYMHAQYQEIHHLYNQSKLENEMTNYLMYHLGTNGVSDIALFQINSFSGLDMKSVGDHYNTIKSIVRDLLTTELGANFPIPNESFQLVPKYVPS